MTARQPRRTRRRVAPAPSSLPRPVTGLNEEAQAEASARLRRAPALGHRQHHVTRDYSYVHRDLITVAAIGVVVIGFIIGMSFVVS